MTPNAAVTPRSQITSSAPPTDIRTPRLLIRRWREDDAEQLHPILEANRAHLGPWIPRHVAEPVPPPQLQARLAGFAADFAAARSWRYALLTPDDTKLLGEVDLLPRTAASRVPYADADRAEIGYWLRADATGQGLATEAARAMVAAARELPRLATLEIRCDARNAASGAVPRRLGFALASTISEGGATLDAAHVELQIWSFALRDGASSTEVAAS